jgi:Tol biopolymer transport system component
MDGSPPVKLGVGSPCAISPDGSRVLAINFGPPHRLVLLPTGSGDSTSLPRGGMDKYNGGSFMPDGKHIVFVGSEAGHGRRTYLQDLEGGSPRSITPEGVAGTAVSPDGRFVACQTKDKQIYLYPTGSGEPKLVASLLPNESVVNWTSDGRALFVRQRGDGHASVSRLDLGTGRREAVRSFELSDPAGAFMGDVALTPDGRSYAYRWARFLDDLYLVRGLR